MKRGNVVIQKIGGPLMTVREVRERTIDTDWFEGANLYKGTFKHDELMKAAELPFGEAIEHMKRGLRVSRDGWNGKRMWLALVKGEQWNIDVPTHSEMLGATLRPFIAMSTVDGSLVPWLASQTDMLAEDWFIVPKITAPANAPYVSTVGRED